jgi:hypothetical protein
VVAVVVVEVLYLPAANVMALPAARMALQEVGVVQVQLAEILQV